MASRASANQMAEERTAQTARTAGAAVNAMASLAKAGMHYNTRSLIMTLIMRKILIMSFGGFLMRIRTHNGGS